MNSHLKRPRITINKRIGSRKKAISQSHIHEIADKKTAYNKGRLYKTKLISRNTDAKYAAVIEQNLNSPNIKKIWKNNLAINRK